MELRERTTWRGREVAWARWGSGPPLVLCHGTPWSSWLWAPYAQALAAEMTVHVWDMPGFGLSSQDADHAVDLATQGELLADLLALWGLDGRDGGAGAAPHVVAHDVGGAVALRAHLLHGVPLASLCLVDAVVLRPWGSPFFRLVREHADVLERLPAAVHRGALEAYVRGASHRGLRDDDLAALVGPWTDDAGRAAFYRQVAQADEAHTAELEPSLGRVAAPVHVVWGAEDTWVPVDRAHRLRDAIPGATLHVVPDAGHLVQLDAPVALATELHRWLAAVR
ncbi:alpha/beta fold hydrolase [Cellulosimicrobium sp. CUA-896]|uniref:alpha/beta fold hydrolase n=1 Tax=Cellulosimicrobium sp. CUA-896 TaxID=1517881 RepID=UPI00095AEF8B|nr:alpha/beta fold hydrolase [Cellulosimicrobium sp. CUA-896]OLT52445.1 alpha/beta hydrolase [Cellulosimicrobium sp. CUA-896]